MSKLRKISDVERTVTMLDLVHAKYGDGGAMSLSHIVIEEVAPGTGWAARRWADVLVLSVWPSNGLTLDGYEVKASKADLKKELSDLSKHEAVARYCDTWWLVAWDESILVEDIPESWGILVTVEGECGRELKVHRKATKRTPEAWPKVFTCSLVRNAYEQSSGAAYVARAVFTAGTNGVAEGRSIERSDWKNAMRPLARALYGENEYRWPAEAHARETLIAAAVDRLAQPALDLTSRAGAHRRPE